MFAAAASFAQKGLAEAFHKFSCMMTISCSKGMLLSPCVLMQDKRSTCGGHHDTIQSQISL